MVQRAGADPDQDLVLAQLRIRNLLVLENFRTAELMNADCFHRVVPLTPGASNSDALTNSQESSQPLYWQMGREGIRQLFICCDQLGSRLHGQSDVETVVHGSIKGQGEA